MSQVLDYLLTNADSVPAIIRPFGHLSSGSSFEARSHVLLRSLRSSSAGVVVAIPGYAPFIPYLWHVGTSPAVVAPAPTPQVDEVPTAEASEPTYGEVLAMPIADQARELLAALALNKSQLAEVLRVSRPTLYDWLDGKEPNAGNTARMVTLLRLLARVGVIGSRPLNARFVRQPLTEGGRSLLDELTAARWDEVRIEDLLRQTRALGARSESKRRSREERLRALGYDEPSDAERRAMLNQNVAMRDWPKR
jgi:hypothetical protein